MIISHPINTNYLHYHPPTIAKGCRFLLGLTTQGRQRSLKARFYILRRPSWSAMVRRSRGHAHACHGPPSLAVSGHCASGLLGTCSQTARKGMSAKITMNTPTIASAPVATSAQPASNGKATAPTKTASKAKQSSKRVAATKSAQLTPAAGAPGDSLVSNGGAQVAPSSPAKVSADVRAAVNPVESAQAEVRRLQGLLRETQQKLAAATADETPAEPISDADLKPLLAEHIKSGAPIGRWALTDAQKAQWKATKKTRKATINGRVYRKRVLSNVTRAANEGGFTRYRERVSAKSKRLTGFALGASFKQPKAKKE